MQDDELALKYALLTEVTPNVYLGSIAMLAFSPVNIAKKMSRIDNHVIIVARLDDYCVARSRFLRRDGLWTQQKAHLSVSKSSIPTQGN